MKRKTVGQNWIHLTSSTPNGNLLVLLSCTVTLLLLKVGPVVQACSVPVFRYALERWPADPYRIVLFHRGALNEDQKRLFESIEKTDDPYESVPLYNLTIQVDDKVPENYTNLWTHLEAEKTELPRLVLLYPEYYGYNVPVWAGEFTKKNLDLLMKSPKREEIGKQLASGTTAVWIMLSSDEPERDKQAKAKLIEELNVAEKQLELPHELDPEDSTYDMSMNDDIELKISFSVVDVDRNDQAEVGLIQSLMKSGQILTEGYGDITEIKGPLAIPVFGQGRALTVLPQDEITNYVVQVCEFLTGPCSCQVKQLNPGLDLFMPFDWYALVDSMIGADEELPPLTVPLSTTSSVESVTSKVAQAIAETKAESAAAAAITNVVQKSGEANNLRRNMLIVVALIILAVVMGTLLVMRK